MKSLQQEEKEEAEWTTTMTKHFKIIMKKHLCLAIIVEELSFQIHWLSIRKLATNHMVKVQQEDLQVQKPHQAEVHQEVEWAALLQLRNKQELLVLAQK